MTTVLIVEDEEGIASFLEKGLAANGFDTVVAQDGEQAAAAVVRGGIDLMLLDLGLPDRDGVDVLTELRERGHVLPVIVLTARDDVPSTVAGLEAGADDYVTKPFSVEELVARIRARIRAQQGEGLLRVGGVTLDLFSDEAHVGSRRVQLTRRESELLQVFMRRPTETLTRAEILSTWAPSNSTTNAVDVYVGYLRKKLGESVVVTVHGTGYRLGDAGDDSTGGETN